MVLLNRFTIEINIPVLVYLESFPEQTTIEASAALYSRTRSIAIYPGSGAAGMWPRTRTQMLHFQRGF